MRTRAAMLRRLARVPAPGAARARGLATLGAAVLCAASGTVAYACDNPNRAIGLERIISIDTRHGPLFGRVTKFARQDNLLKPGEVVLTFDDGPTPGVTDVILDTLAEHCTRATFFAVGQRAVRFPDIIRRIAVERHTLAGHTWSHPNNLNRLKRGRAHDEIERGMAALDLAAGESGIATFFRFPGLNDGRALLGYTQARKLAVFAVDVISNDSFAKSTSSIVSRTLRQARKQKGGILLFHDLKKRTARALPSILRKLKAERFKVVHLVSTQPFVRDKGYDSVLRPNMEKALARRMRSAPAPKVPRANGQRIPVTQITPEQAPFEPEIDVPHPKPAAERAAISAERLRGMN